MAGGGCRARKKGLARPEDANVLAIFAMRFARNLPALASRHLLQRTVPVMNDANSRVIVDVLAGVAELLAEEELLGHQEGRRPELLEAREETRRQEITRAVALVNRLCG